MSPTAKILHASLGYLCLVPAVYGVRHFIELTPTLKAFTLLMCLSVICEIPSSILYHHHQNNAIIEHVYVPIQAILMCYAFSFHLGSFIRPPKLILIGVLFAIFSILNTFFVQPYYVSNSYANGTLTGIIMLMILGYFFALIKSDSAQPLSTIPEVWIYFFLLIHLSASFFMYISGNLLALLPIKTVKLIAGVRSYSMLFFYLSIALGIWIHRKQRA